MTVLPAFEHTRPTGLDEAIGLLGDGGVPYHGGTELIAVMRLGLVQPELLVDLKAVEGLRGVTHEGGQLRIGAGTTHLEIGRHPEVRRHAPLLAHVAGLVGNVRVRATGTIGGNLCFAEPRSDVATALMALGATVTLRSAGGERSLPVADFCLGAYVTDLRPGELLTRIDLPAGAAGAAVYRKLQTTERPTVGVAAVSPGAAAGRYRVVVGAVGERPAAFEEDDLGGFDPLAMAAGIEVIGDLSGQEDYKRHVTAVYVGRALAALAGEEAA